MSQQAPFENLRLVTVTHVDDSARSQGACVYLWAKYVEGSYLMDKCIENIENILEGRPAPLHLNLRVGQICCVLINQQWQRACVEDLELNPEQKLKVQLVDYGSSYYVALTSLRTLENINGRAAKHIQECHPIAFKFILADVVASRELENHQNWSEMAISFLKNEVQNHLWKANSLGIHEECQVLRLFLPLVNQVNLATAMIRKGFGVPAQSYLEAICTQWIHHTQAPQRNANNLFLVCSMPSVNSLLPSGEHLKIVERCTDYSLLKIEIGQKQVYVSHIETPEKFWIQLAENEQSIVDIDVELMEIGMRSDSHYLLDSPPVVGQLYNVKHPEFGN